VPGGTRSGVTREVARVATCKVGWRKTVVRVVSSGWTALN
jgi:hypothetical protein